MKYGAGEEYVRAGVGVGKVRMLPTKTYVPQTSAPPRRLRLERGGHSGLHPHAAVGHPGPEPALPVDGVLTPVLEADKADAGPVVGEGVGDLGSGGRRVWLGPRCLPQPPQPGAFSSL